MSTRQRILIVAAHPDDEILGCGGTVARLVTKGHEAYTLILGEGITSRDAKRKREKKEKDIKLLREQAFKANKGIGVKKVFLCDFPDNRFDTVALLDIVKTIEKIKSDIRPHIIYTHHRADLNIDHRITYNAVLTACRPLRGETVRAYIRLKPGETATEQDIRQFCQNRMADYKLPREIIFTDAIPEETALWARRKNP